uniref:RHD domain-containing protein n=1 Tax=Macrostomum lignano TaxID=282301 RepID=A0A1I8HPZ0_9PLAT
LLNEIVASEVEYCEYSGSVAASDETQVNGRDFLLQAEPQILSLKEPPPPSLTIEEQPARFYGFRYESQQASYHLGRLLLGRSSTDGNKSFVRVRVSGIDPAVHSQLQLTVCTAVHVHVSAGLGLSLPERALQDVQQGVLNRTVSTTARPQPSSLAVGQRFGLEDDPNRTEGRPGKSSAPSEVLFHVGHKTAEVGEPLAACERGRLPVCAAIMFVASALVATTTQVIGRDFLLQEEPQILSLKELQPPTLTIEEQPARFYRYRYESDIRMDSGRVGGLLLGRSSTDGNKSF